MDGAFTTPGIEALADSSRTNEFATEARLSLERAFVEEHRIEDAAIELKTMRMSSNVLHRQVRQVVIEFLVDKIDVAGDAAAQKQSIGKVIGRWGPLLNELGALDGQETVELLQVRVSNVQGCRLTPLLRSAALGPSTLTCSCTFSARSTWRMW